MKVNITIKNAVKKYGNNTVISGMNVKVKGGEFFTLLGPSGCGKTTLLRMIAGFNSIEGGDFYFNDKRINQMDPGKRNIGMVFQNYAIFPHLSVANNVAFGLKNRKISKEQLPIETDKFLKLMQIFEFRDRMPDKLSGGQQQRVALARALVIKPAVLLMDEPLSNLDAKLRVEMRGVIKEIQNKMGITTVYVTHDQEEAMAVSDRIAVLNKGEIQHIGTPKDLYQRPANLFVATFIGRTNIFEAELNKTILTLKDGFSVKLNNLIDEKHSGKVQLSVRPEEFVITDDKDSIHAVIDDSIFLGLNTHYFAHIAKTNEKIEIIQESSISNIIPRGTKINVKLNLEKINLFDESGDQNLILGVKNDNEA